MGIPYSLFPNNLTPDPTDFAAAVQTKGTADFDAIALRISEQDNTVGEVDVLAVLRAMEKTCQALLIEGNRVVLGGLVQLFPRVRGIFSGAADVFDPARHRIDVGANPGQRVRNAVREQATVEKVRAIKPAPEVLEYVDFATQQVNAAVTPSRSGKIEGSRLKYDPAQPDEGVFFVPTDGGPAVQPEIVSVNLPAEIHFENPTLAPGSYGLEIRTRVAGGTELRIGNLDGSLTVS